jgi:predicted DNA-binding protein with PD1-like motif
MLSTESRRGRRILARIDRGHDLFEAIRTLCQRHGVRCGEVRGAGTLELAELVAFDQAERRWKPGRVVSGGGGLQLLHLVGNLTEERGALSVQLHATLMRERDTGVEVTGGALRRATAYAVELVIESFDDVIVRRLADAQSGLSLWSEALAEPPVANIDAPALAPPPAPAPPLPPEPPALPALPPPAAVAPPMPSYSHTPSWSEVAAVSQGTVSSAPPAPPRPPAPRVDNREEDIVLNAGDVILHPRFQRCVVHRVEGGGEFIQVMLKNGRVVRLSLEVIRLTPQGTENGQRVFAATVL